jgi:ribonuclease-3
VELALDRALDAHFFAREMSGREPLGALEARLGYVFKDKSLLETALTHVSVAQGLANYQRLEFLGDRVLGLAVAELLNAAYPSAREGELSKRLAALVRRETCVEIALAWRVGPHLRLGQGERQTGGESKPAILGDVTEAILGAAFLDGGWEVAQALVERFWGDRVDRQSRRLVDPKTELQEWAQARGLAPPTYVEAERVGPDHAPSFVIRVELQGFPPCDGPPEASKKIATKAAALAFLTREGVAGR